MIFYLMNPICRLVLFLFFFSGCQADKTPSLDYWKFLDLKGHVKEVVLLEYAMKGHDDRSTDNPTSEKTTLFTETGQLIKTEFKQYSDRVNGYLLSNRVLYKYDEKGLLKYEETYDSSNHLTLKYDVSQVNDLGFPIEEKLMLGRGVPRMITDYLEGSRIRKSYDRDFLVDRWVKRYDQNSNVIEEQLTYFGDKNDSITYRKSYAYKEFDEFGNWTYRTVFTGDVKEPVSAERREIKYYD